MDKNKNTSKQAKNGNTTAKIRTKITQGKTAKCEGKHAGAVARERHRGI
jgi:hypothetical protein